MNDLSVIIPVFNSSISIEELVGLLKKNYPDCEIILIDDNSKDDSYLKLKLLYKKYKYLKIIRLDKNYGQQQAIKCGLKFASKNYIVTMDDDLQHPVSEIIKLIAEVKKGYDVCYGINYNKPQNFLRKMGSKLTDRMFNVITNKPKSIKVSSFRCLNKNLVKKINEDNTSFVYLSAITLKLTKNIKTIVVKNNKRKYGKSQYSYFKLIKLFILLYIYYKDNTIFEIFRKNKAQYKIAELHI